MGTLSRLQTLVAAMASSSAASACRSDHRIPPDAPTTARAARAAPVAAAALSALSVPPPVAVAFLLGTGPLLVDAAAQSYAPSALDRDPAHL
jgi:hypothetical protein